MFVELEGKHFGSEGKPVLLIVHGFLGSSRNWLTVGADLSATFDVYALDARNHGKSPHVDEMSYEAMLADVVAWLDKRGIERVSFMGHSMGGKLGMLFACRYPERVERLIVSDIAPKKNDETVIGIGLNSMAALDLNAINKRSDAEEALKERVPALGMRKFLLTNLERTDDGHFRWSVNLSVLVRDFKNIADNPLNEDDCYDGPTLFVRGGLSNFIKEKDAVLIKKHFPRASIVTIKNAGHNVHIDEREAFVAEVLEFSTLQL